MRPITKLIVHCAYTPPSMDIGVTEIREWHTDRGWKDIGYHWVIRRDGTIEIGRPEEIAGAHTFGQNRDSLGICLVGGKKEGDTAPDCNFTMAQYSALAEVIADVRERHPGIEVSGHRDWANRACPTFDAKEFVK